MVMVPELVTVGLVTVRKEFPDATVTEVTVPDVAGEAQDRVPAPLVVRI